MTNIVIWFGVVHFEPPHFCWVKPSHWLKISGSKRTTDLISHFPYSADSAKAYASWQKSSDHFDHLIWSGSFWTRPLLQSKVCELLQYISSGGHAECLWPFWSQALSFADDQNGVVNKHCPNGITHFYRIETAHSQKNTLPAAHAEWWWPNWSPPLSLIDN